MMNLQRNLINRMLKICADNFPRVNRRHRHFSFLCRRTHIIAYGYAQKSKTHPKVSRWFRYNSIHSEFDALRHVWGEDLSGMYLVNIRIKLDGSLSLSRPCPCCTRMLLESGIERVYYSKSDGTFGQLSFT